MHITHHVFIAIIFFSNILYSSEKPAYKSELFQSLKPSVEFEKAESVKKIPIIYSPNYDISFFYLEKLHLFDTCKYSKVFNTLAKKCNFTQKNCFGPRKPVSDEDLRKVHSKEYLASINGWVSSSATARIAEMPPLAFIPNVLLCKKLLHPMRLATQGTIIGIEKAFKHGWAINLSGGYHHAKHGNGEGFCFFADIPLAIVKMRKNAEHANKKVLIVDLDAHHGNGHVDCCKDDELTIIFDVYNKDAYPVRHVSNPKKDIQDVAYNYPIVSYTNDEAYLNIVKKNLPKAIEETNPNLIIYNAGTDILKGDRVGGLSVSREGIVERDRLVFQYAKEKEIPILMTLSGGYTQESASIIAESIEKVHGDAIKAILENKK
ncbi:MAG TPA: histone deacetylase [Candidatus Bathyarchaeia archaeon]|nr:histone deacetylase [Candidatus Bathyarchaeia archaeon]